MSFTEKLQSIQNKKGSLLCIGLDTDLKKIPPHLLRAENPQLEFNRRIIEATAEFACAFKINAAMYECHGDAGWKTIKESAALIPKDSICIIDAKRGDIGNTSAYYASALYDGLGADAITVNPYMGSDSVEPFLQHENRCAFVLALTSNAGALDFQHLRSGDRLLYEHVIATALTWNAKGTIGFVVGATRGEQLRSVRTLAPLSPLLIPGIGAQGGSIDDAVRYGCTKDGTLAVINASRSILYASPQEDFAAAARNEAKKLCTEMQKAREKYL